MAPKINGLGIMPEDTRICVVMVGLPARGKSYIAQRGKASSALHLLCAWRR
jgi:6-phosphofructo-2-kinase/fructose-2,6-biphosphatase 2